MNTIDKLKKLRDENPTLANAIELEFPEIVDRMPYIYANTLFMKKCYLSNLYTLIYTKHTFRIVNLKDNIQWSGQVIASNKGYAEDPYLTKRDFKNLLEQSNCNLDTIEFLDYGILSSLHMKLFKNEKV